MESKKTNQITVVCFFILLLNWLDGNISQAVRNALSVNSCCSNVSDFERLH
jgi:hypothetical protein